jgi:hypothetical protein
VKNLSSEKTQLKIEVIEPFELIYWKTEVKNSEICQKLNPCCVVVLNSQALYLEILGKSY